MTVTLTADQHVHPYLIRLLRGEQQIAYAVRSAYGWTVCAHTLVPGRPARLPHCARCSGARPARSGIATIGRTGHDRYAVETALLLVASARGGAR